MENLKDKIQALINDRQRYIIQKYDKPGNILPSEEDVKNCRKELNEDPIIVELNRQLVELAQKSTDISI